MLDTHAFIWWMLDDPKLRTTVRDAIEDPVNELFLSAVSVAEMAVKVRLKKLDFGEPLDALVTRTLASGQIGELPLQIGDTVYTAVLPPVHRDPFDRLLIGQSIAQGIALVTNDADIRRYPVTVYWP